MVHGKFAIHDNEIYLDFKTGADSLSKKMLASFDNTQDSTNAQTTFRLMKYFFRDLKYVFNKDSGYQLLKNGLVMEKGIYTVNDDKKVITLKQGSGKQRLPFTLHGRELQLQCEVHEKTLNFILEKEN